MGDDMGHFTHAVRRSQAPSDSRGKGPERLRDQRMVPITAPAPVPVVGIQLGVVARCNVLPGLGQGDIVSLQRLPNQRPFVDLLNEEKKEDLNIL